MEWTLPGSGWREKQEAALGCTSYQVQSLKLQVLEMGERGGYKQ